MPQPELFGIDLGSTASFRGLDGKVPSPILGFFVLIVAILLCLFVANLRRSSLGQRMVAVRANERAAAAVGVNVRNVKIAGFTISSFIAGVAGVLYAYNFGSVSANRFSALTALGLIAFAYIGGITMVSGALDRRGDLDRGVLPSRVGGVVRAVGNLGAAPRRRVPDLQPHLLPGRGRRRFPPQAAAEEGRAGAPEPVRHTDWTAASATRAGGKGFVTMMKAISGTDLKVFPLCLGGNPFGWTVDRERRVRGARRLPRLPAATSSTPPTPTAPGSTGSAASRNRSSASGTQPAATATSS